MSDSAAYLATESGQVPQQRNVTALCRRLVPKILRSQRPTERDWILAQLLPLSVGVEIGVHIGDFSDEIILAAQPLHLYLIDPWRHEEDDAYSRSWYGGKGSHGQDVMDGRYESVRHRFRREGQVPSCV